MTISVRVVPVFDQERQVFARIDSSNRLARSQPQCCYFEQGEWLQQLNESYALVCSQLD